MLVSLFHCHLSPATRQQISVFPRRPAQLRSLFATQPGTECHQGLTGEAAYEVSANPGDFLSNTQTGNPSTFLDASLGTPTFLQAWDMTPIPQYLQYPFEHWVATASGDCLPRQKTAPMVASRRMMWIMSVPSVDRNPSVNLWPIPTYQLSRQPGRCWPGWPSLEIRPLACARSRAPHFCL